MVAGADLLHHQHSQEEHDHHGCTTLCWSSQLRFTCRVPLSTLWCLKAQELKVLKSGEPPTSNRNMSVWLFVLFGSVSCGSHHSETVHRDSETRSESVKCFGASCSAAGE